jgi:hypothetical protein
MEIRDYLRCPLYYKLKNVDELPMDKSIDEYFKDYFKLAIYFYYFSIIEKKPKSVEGMMKRWEDLWFSRDMLETFPESALKEKSSDAAIIMSNFFKKYGSERVTPIAANFQYEAIFVGEENIHVTGTIDLIKILNDRTKKSETCICSLNMNKSPSDLFLLKNNIMLSVAAFAFRSSFKSIEDRIIISNLRSQEDVPTIRTSGDFIRAEKAIRNICYGIKQGVFYPNPSPINCNNCPFKGFCLNEKSINMRGKIDVRV